MEISRLLLQAMLFISAIYCDDATILDMGFADRSEAKSSLYARARLLFHADWEKDGVTLTQGLFLMSFWRGDKFDVRDVRYWLGVAITVAESCGLHRDTPFNTSEPQIARLRRRLWWSIYVRERQSAVSLGLPSRIRDEDCDIKPLNTQDFDEQENYATANCFGSCTPQHVTYALKMVEIAQLLGKIIDLHFVPGRPPSTSEEVQNLDKSLLAWRRSLPEDMRGHSDNGPNSVLAYLMQLAFNHLRILIFRNAFLRHSGEYNSGQIVLTAACQISRIAEDMLTHGMLRYGQMHVITSLFAALCIHAISIRRATGTSRRIAENRAQMCLLALKEIQKYWRINNNVLELFLHYLDESIAKRLQDFHEDSTHSSVLGDTRRDDGVPYDIPPGSTRINEFEHMPAVTGVDPFEDQYFGILSSQWEGELAMSELGLFLDP
ncbi:hypothetical protein DV736_g4322, partial [Chaetothyriales sp. CBS 134916]